MAADIPPEMPHWWDGFVANGELVFGTVSAGIVALIGWVWRLETRLQAMRGLPARVETLEKAEDANRTTLAVIAHDVSATKAAVMRLEDRAMRERNP